MNKRSLLSFFIVGALFMCGCADTHHPIGSEIEVDIIEAEYGGHSYLIFSHHGVVHSPDCKCVTDKQQ